MFRTVREAIAAFRRAPALTGLSALMIALSLFVVGLFAVAAHNIRRVLDQVESRVQVVAYLRDDAAPEAVELAIGEVRTFPEVLDATYVSRDQALDAARRELPEFHDLFAGAEVNPLPASIEVGLRPGQRDPDAVRAVADRIAGYPFVEDVRYGREWVDKIFLLRRIAGAAALVVGIAFAAVAILIIGAAVRLAIVARRDEIEIMRLVGATDAFVRRPFLLEGMLTGLLGAGLATSLTYVTYRIVFDSIVRLDWIPDAWIAGGVAGGALLGIVASHMAVRRYLRDS